MVNPRFKQLGELFYVLSYICLGLYIAGGIHKVIFSGDALHGFCVLQGVGALLGGTRWGGPRLLAQVEILGARPSVRILVWLVWSVLWTAVGIARHWGLNTGLMDMGQFSQVIWGLAHGQGYLTTWSTSATNRFLDFHQAYSFVLLAPLFWTPWGPELLLFVQALAVFCPPLVVCPWIVHRFEVSSESMGRLLAGAAALTWFFYAPSASKLVWDAHETIIDFPALSAWSFGLVTGSLPWFLGGSILAGLTKEHLLILTLAAFPVFAWVHRNKQVGTARLLPTVLLLLAVAGAQLALFRFNLLHVAKIPFVARYDRLGASVGQVILHCFTEPKVVLSILVEPARLQFFKDVFSSTLFAPLFAGWLTLAWLPFYFAHALSGHPAQYMTQYHYTMEIWGAVAPTAILVGLKWTQRVGKIVPLALVFAAIWNAGPSPVAQFFDYLPMARACHGTIEQMKRDLNQAMVGCNPAQSYGASTARMFAQFVDVATSYEARPLTEMSQKPEFERVFRGRSCAFYAKEDAETWVTPEELGPQFQRIGHYTDCPRGAISLFLRRGDRPELSR